MIHVKAGPQPPAYRPDDMDSASTLLAREHAYCDALLADVEAAVAASDWARAEIFYPAFSVAIRRHFETEEAVLFPAFETATGSCVGPTQTMRSEHDRIRELLAALGDALRLRDRDACLGHSETLLWQLCEHKLKEEAMFDSGHGSERTGPNRA